MPKNPALKTIDPYCETRYRAGLSDNDKFSMLESLKLSFWPNDKINFNANSDIYVYVSTPTSEPRCKQLRIELSKSDGEILENRNYDVVPTANKEWKLGNFNSQHKLKNGTYFLSVYYGEKLVKKSAFSIK